ncbi:MAG: beta-ketoacyl synthase N-terminal-like domain-containing protein [Vicinamibacterales bacterium]
MVITGIGVVSPFGVGRERFWSQISAGRSGARVVDDLDEAIACRVAAPVTGVTIDDVPPLDGDDIWDPEYRADPKRYSRAALIGVIAAREAWSDAGLRVGEEGASVVIGSGGGGIDVGEKQYYDFFVERGRKVTPYAIPISIVGMMSSENLHFTACPWSEPRAVVWLHELDRRDWLRRCCHPRGRRRGRALGRRRCVRDARHALRVRTDACGVDGIQRVAGDGIAPLRSLSRRVRAG